MVREELERIMPVLAGYRKQLEGKRAAIYVGGAFKAFSLVSALRHLGMKTVMVGSQTGNKDDYEQLRELCDEGTIIADDSNPLELSSFLEEKDVDVFIGGVKERPIAYKLGIGFCDHNQIMALTRQCDYVAAFYDLDGPPVRITTPHIPLPAADILEDIALPTVDRIVDRVHRSMQG